MFRICLIIMIAMQALCLAGTVRANTNELVVYTEHYPPFNYESSNGTVEGVATEKVRQVLDATGVPYRIVLLPWARAVNKVRTEDNALIYMIMRTPRREFGFDWLMPLSESNFHLFVRANETRKVTKEALRAGVFTASCVSGDVACELLLWAGIPTSKITPIPQAGTGDFRMVLAGRADIYISDLRSHTRLRRKEGYDPAIMKPVMRVDNNIDFYLAAGLRVPANIRTEIKKTYKQLVEAGSYSLVRVDEGMKDGGR